jgi:hypothetical protein
MEGLRDHLAERSKQADGDQKTIGYLLRKA